MRYLRINVFSFSSDLLGEEPTIENLVDWLTEDLKNRSIVPSINETEE